MFTDKGGKVKKCAKCHSKSCYRLSFNNQIMKLVGATAFQLNYYEGRKFTLKYSRVHSKDRLMNLSLTKYYDFIKLTHRRTSTAR